MEIPAFRGLHDQKRKTHGQPPFRHISILPSLGQSNMDIPPIRRGQVCRSVVIHENAETMRSTFSFDLSCVSFLDSIPNWKGVKAE